MSQRYALHSFGLVVLFAAAGCGDARAPGADTGVDPAVVVGSDTGPAHDMGGMHDHAGMQRHAAEADSAAAAMRGHVAEMRGLSPAEQHDRIGEHVGEVSRLLGLMERHMREMGHGTGMDDEHMGQMMGMSAAEHRRMMDDMRELRAEAERLQTASQAEVRRLMPEHLVRLEGFVGMMERSAAHMAAH